MQVSLYKFRWCKRQPLVQRYIGKMVTLEQFQETQPGITGVLDIMSHRKGHVPHVTRLIVESTRRTASGKYRPTSLTLNIVLPLVVIGMPVQFAHGPRLNLHQRRRNSRCHRKVGRVGNTHRAPWHTLWLLSQHMMAKGRWYCPNR